MPISKVLARDWKVEINTGTDALPTWTEIKGLSTLTFSGGKNDADGTSFDSDGWEEHLVASRNRTLSMEGFYLEDPVTGDRDPGQDAVETLGEKVGADSLGQFRVTSPGATIRTFNGSVNIGDVGGGNDDNTSWGAEIRVSGKVTTT